MEFAWPVPWVWRTCDCSEKGVDPVCKVLMGQCHAAACTGAGSAWRGPGAGCWATVECLAAGSSGAVWLSERPAPHLPVPHCIPWLEFSTRVTVCRLYTKLLAQDKSQKVECSEVLVGRGWFAECESRVPAHPGPLLQLRVSVDRWGWGCILPPAIPAPASIMSEVRRSAGTSLPNVEELFIYWVFQITKC